MKPRIVCWVGGTLQTHFMPSQQYTNDQLASNSFQLASQSTLQVFDLGNRLPAAVPGFRCWTSAIQSLKFEADGPPEAGEMGAQWLGLA